MLAIGRSLHHPFQSVENGYRQFLACNELFDKKIIRKELMLLLNKDSSDPFYRTSPIFKLFREWLDPNFINARRAPHRNCQRCGESFYHSSLFDLPWLRNCPLHPQERLTENCPECGKRWFSNSKTCSCCGIHVRFSIILQRRQCAGASWDLLKSLKSLVTNFHRKCHLTQENLSRSFLHVDEDDRIFPSLAAHLFPEYTHVFAKLGVDIEPCTESTFEEVSREKQTSDSLRKRRTEIFSVEDVTEQVMSFIEPDLNQNSRGVDSENDFDNASTTAFTLWRDLITTKYKYGLGYNFNTQCYQICFGVSGPERPEQTNSLVFERGGGQRESILVPEALKMMLYKYDLRLKYFSILEALLYFNSELTIPFDHRKPIPALAYPNVSSARFIDVVYEDGKIRLISPAWLKNGDPIGLFRFFGGEH